MKPDELLSDLNAWQNFLNQERDVFFEIKIGGRIGLLAKSCFEDENNQLQVWEMQDNKLIVSIQKFTGFNSSEVDIIFVADDEALEAIYRELQNDALIEFRKQIRHGNVVFYVMKNRAELLAMGYEELIETLGIPWLGTCH